MARTILIIIDGCRPDALRQASSPNIDCLAAGGAHKFDATTVVPSVTLPVHFSIFTSQQPVSHSVLTNTGRPAPSPSATTLVEQAKTYARSCAAVYSWEFLRNLAPPGTLDLSFYLNTTEGKERDLQTAATAADCLLRFRPDFLFVYLVGMDKAGHQHGWMSKAYFKALKQADTAVGILMESLASNGMASDTNIILHSDHGGKGTQHQEPLPENLTIPWIASGPGIVQNHSIAAPVSVLDTAPTLAHLLGIPPHHSWEGRAVLEIFDTQPAPTSTEMAADPAASTPT